MPQHKVLTSANGMRPARQRAKRRLYALWHRRGVPSPRSVKCLTRTVKRTTRRLQNPLPCLGHAGQRILFQIKTLKDHASRAKRRAWEGAEQRTYMIGQEKPNRALLSMRQRCCVLLVRIRMHERVGCHAVCLPWLRCGIGGRGWCLKRIFA